MDPPAVVRRQADGHARQLEAARHVAGQRVDRTHGFGRQQHVPRQVEQARHLVPACDGLVRTGLDGGRQIARDDGDDQKGEQRDPVLRIGDRERADRRKEEEVQRQHGHDGDDRGDPEPSQRGCGQHDQEQRQRGGRRADVRNQPEHQRHGGGRQQRADQDHDVPSSNPDACAVLRRHCDIPRAPSGWQWWPSYGLFMAFLREWPVRSVAGVGCQMTIADDERPRVLCSAAVSMQKWLGMSSLVAVVAIGAASCGGSLQTSLERLLEARRLSSDLLVQFSKTVDAGNRAVMADTDDASTAFAGEAEAGDAGDPERCRCVGADSDEPSVIRPSRACSISFGAASPSTARWTKPSSGWRWRTPTSRRSGSPLVPRNSRPTRSETLLTPSRRAARRRTHGGSQALAATAVAAVREIQVLQAPHIAEADDATMTRIETQMATSEAAARRALEMLDWPGSPGFPPAADRRHCRSGPVHGRQRRDRVLSRRNSNVRSLALSLGQKRMLTASVRRDASCPPGRSGEARVWWHAISEIVTVL